MEENIGYTTIVDKNTLYVTSSTILDTLAFQEYMEKLISNIILILKEECYITDIRSTFLINSPKKQGKSCKYAYIWIDSKEIVNVILGFNPDGSKRVIKTRTELSTNDCFDEDDWFSEPVVRIEETILPPLISIPTLVYGEKEHVIDFERFFSPLPSDEFRRDSLICLSVPDEVENRIIYNIFSRYGIKSKPKVRRFGTKVVVMFDANSDDASFALAMQMITKIEVGTNTHILRFTRNRFNKK